jgi:maltose alpha-D-glucosyltransferase/alpha-amylase
VKETPRIPSSLFESASQDLPPLLQELIGGVYREMAGLLGRRTAELHLALSLQGKNPVFTPEPFTLLYQRSLYQSMQSLTKRVFGMLKKQVPYFTKDLKQQGREVLSYEQAILERFQGLLRGKIAATKMRIHGDYHLGQVLFTGNDFVIIDFEGEPARALSERRLKRSPLRDVAGMIRSFHYAAYAALFKQVVHNPDDMHRLEVWADLWYKCAAGAFLKSYRNTVKGTDLLPRDERVLERLLETLLLEKVIYELGYELNNRPEWIAIPLKGIRHLLQG